MSRPAPPCRSRWIAVLCIGAAGTGFPGCEDRPPSTEPATGATVRAPSDGSDETDDDERTPQAAAPPRFPENLYQTMEPSVAQQFKVAQTRLDAEPDDQQRMAHLGALFQAYEYFASAESCYRLVIAGNATNPAWHYYLGVTLLEQGKLDEAARSLEQMLQFTPGYTAALLRLGEIERRLGHYDRAMIRYDEAFATDVDQERALLGRAQVMLQLDDPQRAETQLRQALALTPEFGKARYALGLALRRQNRLDEARDEFARAERQRDIEPPTTDPLGRRVAELERGAFAAVHAGSDLLRRQAGPADVALAIERFREAIRIDPNFAEAYSQLGSAQLLLGDDVSAEQNLRRALTLNGASVDARYNLGLIHYRRGDYAPAIDEFEHAVEVRFDHFDAQLGLGTALRRVARSDEALRRFEVASAIRPEDPRPYLRAGQVLIDGRRYEDAVEILRTGRARAPENARIMERLALLYAASPAATVRQADVAIALAERAMALTAGAAPQVLATYAAALANAGRLDEARQQAAAGLDLARAAGRTDLIATIEQHLARYHADEPIRLPE